MATASNHHHGLQEAQLAAAEHLGEDPVYKGWAASNGGGRGGRRPTTSTVSQSFSRCDKTSRGSSVTAAAPAPASGWQAWLIKSRVVVLWGKNSETYNISCCRSSKTIHRFDNTWAVIATEHFKWTKQNVRLLKLQMLLAATCDIDAKGLTENNWFLTPFTSKL